MCPEWFRNNFEEFQFQGLLSQPLELKLFEIASNQPRNHTGHERNYKEVQYYDIESGTNLFNLLTKFQECSGLEVNRSKTKGMWLGSSRTNTITPLGIAWPANSILAQGINFSHDDEIVRKKNFEQKLLP